MWAVTGWALATWAKLTALLAVVLGVCWWQLDTSTFALACVGAALVELWLIAALFGEWVSEARSSWWWTA